MEGMFVLRSVVVLSLVVYAASSPSHLQELFGSAPNNFHSGHDSIPSSGPLNTFDQARIINRNPDGQTSPVQNNFGSFDSNAPSTNFGGSQPVAGLYQAPEAIALQSQVQPIQLENFIPGAANPDVTVTSVSTYDVFRTSTNLFYNTIPVTLTEFVRSTVVAPTFKVDNTPVNDIVVASTVPVTVTNIVTVKDTSTQHQYVTDVSTDYYTITHKAYDIRQQLVNSTVVQTEVFRPTIVSTVVLSEYDTSTVTHTVTNTIVLSPPKQFYGAPVAQPTSQNRLITSKLNFNNFASPSTFNQPSLDSLNKATYDVLDVALRGLQQRIGRIAPGSQLFRTVSDERSKFLRSSNLNAVEQQAYLENLFNRVVEYTKSVENAEAGGYNL